MDMLKLIEGPIGASIALGLSFALMVAVVTGIISI